MTSEEQKLTQRWMDLASQASEENDPQKLTKIVKDLCSLLDAEKKPPASSPARTDQPRKNVHK
jgi:hypothetical protein